MGLLSKTQNGHLCRAPASQGTWLPLLSTAALHIACLPQHTSGSCMSCSAMPCILHRRDAALHHQRSRSHAAELCALRTDWELPCTTSALAVCWHARAIDPPLWRMSACVEHPDCSSGLQNLRLQASALCGCQVWLQMFAWAEHDTAAILQQRAADLPAPQQQLMEGEPLFCLEVAIKLLYFAGMAYEHDEVGTAASLCPRLPCTGTRPAQKTMCCSTGTRAAVCRRPTVGFTAVPAQLSSAALPSQRDEGKGTMLHGALSDTCPTGHKVLQSVRDCGRAAAQPGNAWASCGPAAQSGSCPARAEVPEPVPSDSQAA